MYATNPFSWFFFNKPWNVGIIGSNPLTILACGFSIDSRMYASSARTDVPLFSSTIEPYTPFQLGPLLLVPSTLWQELQPTRS